jgi:ribosomal protein L11 methyltransferase
MPWLQIILETEASMVEEISEALVSVGAISVTWQDAENQPLYEPPLNSTPIWKQTQVIGLFEENTNSSQLQAQLQAVLAPKSLPPCQIQTLADQDWNRVWMDDFHPMQFGERVWICPSWQKPPNPQAVNIFIDPGLAFGTGTHPTTALCLEWLDGLSDLSDKTFIDYGCGSGILAITAAKLGAKQVWAVDNDPQALQATEDNAKKNQVDKRIHPVFPEKLPNKIKADGILANILANPLITLANTFAMHLKSPAPLVLSGILKEQADEVIAAYSSHFTITEVLEQDDWIRIVACKKF